MRVKEVRILLFTLCTSVLLENFIKHLQFWGNFSNQHGCATIVTMHLQNLLTIPNWNSVPAKPGVSNSFSPGAISASRLPSRLNIILGLCKCNYSLCSRMQNVSKSSMLSRGRNKVPGQIKQGGGLDSARQPCVCHLCINQ